MPRWLVGLLLVFAAYFPAALWSVRSYVDPAPKGATVVMLMRPFERFGNAASARVWVPDEWLGPSDTEDDFQRSPVVVYEDGRRLGPAHANHGDIARYGAGRYSQSPGLVVFSASDNSDPNLNGRRYWAVIP